MTKQSQVSREPPLNKKTIGTQPKSPQREVQEGKKLLQDEDNKKMLKAKGSRNGR